MVSSELAYGVSLYNDIFRKPMLGMLVVDSDVNGICMPSIECITGGIAMNVMNGKKFFAKSWMTAFIAVAFACLASAAPAEIVSTEQALQQSDRERVQEFLNRAEVEDGLKKLGVVPADARQRVNAMTPEEVRTVAGRMDTLAAGGEASETDWVIILLGAIVLILLI